MEQERTEIVVPPEGGGERLDVYLVREFPEMTRATAQRLVSEGHVLVNGQPQKSSLKLRGGETIIVEIPPPREVLPEPESIDLNIVYEDAHLVVLNKEAGMVVHQGAGNFTGTLVNALLAHCGDLSGIGGELRPGIVHRIDKDTTGLLVVAKSDRAHQGLSHQFKEHTIKRLYQALVYGSPKEDSGKIDSAIGRHPVDRKKMAGGVKHGKHAVTRWHVLARYEGVSHMKLRLETGRTHQIRVHLSEAGHPLVGDPVYSSGRIGNIRDPKLKSLITKLDRQALHAKTLGFVHPVTQEYLEFDSELPADMQAIIDYLSGDEPEAL